MGIRSQGACILKSFKGFSSLPYSLTPEVLVPTPRAQVALVKPEKRTVLGYKHLKLGGRFAPWFKVTVLPGSPPGGNEAAAEEATTATRMTLDLGPGCSVQHGHKGQVAVILWAEETSDG